MCDQANLSKILPDTPNCAAPLPSHPHIQHSDSHPELHNHMWRQPPLSQAPILPLQLATQPTSGVLHSETTDALYWPRLSTHQSGSPGESEALTSLHSSSKPGHDEKLKRLQHRLYEVLE
ncbi:hypothetical protein GGH92_009642, partial [Coemansia sp. RSA 2673]